MAEVPGVEVICRDVLEFDFPGAAREAGRPLAVVGNLPYQITSPLLFTLIRDIAAIAEAVLMMQQEVGARLLASPGTKDYGILSVLVQYHFRITRLFSLSPGNFFPPPQVDSVVLRLAPETPAPAALDQALFQRLVKLAFGHRRKTLNNTLVSGAAALGLSPGGDARPVDGSGHRSQAPGRNPERGGICGHQQPSGAHARRAGGFFVIFYEDAAACTSNSPTKPR